MILEEFYSSTVLSFIISGGEHVGMLAQTKLLAGIIRIFNDDSTDLSVGCYIILKDNGGVK